MGIFRLAKEYGFPALLVLGLCLALLVLAGNNNRNGGLFSSDDLYAAAFCDQVLGDAFSMTGFHFPGAPYVFPDLIFLTPLAAVCSDVVILYLIYSLLFFAALLAVLTWMGKRAGLAGREAFCLTCLGAFLLVIVHADPDYINRGRCLLIPGSHLGAVLVGLFLTALVLHSLDRPMRWFHGALFVVGGALTAFSDKLLIVQFLLPLTLTLALLWLVRLVSWKCLLANLVLVLLALAGSMLLKKWLLKLGFVLLLVEDGVKLTNWQRSLAAFVRDLPLFLHGQRLLMGLILLFWIITLSALFLWMPALAARWRWKASRQPDDQGGSPVSAGAIFLVVFAVLAWVCNLGAVLGLGIWECQFHERYLLFPLFMSFPFTGFFLHWVPWGHPLVSRLARYGWTTAVLGLGGYLLLAQAPHWQARNLRRNDYPELTQVLDDLARDKGIRHGLAPFWYARRHCFLSRENVRIGTIWSDASPYLHADNPNRFLDPDPDDLTIPTYQFMIIPKGFDNTAAAIAHGDTPDPAKILSEFGEPQEIRRVGQDEIWLYERLNSEKLDQFLNGLLAEKCRRRLDGIRPAQPADLGIAKHSYSSCNVKGSVPIFSEKDVLIHYAQPVHGRTLDFSASYLDSFEVEFLRGQHKLGKLEVPPIHWCSDFSESLGLQPRLLALPEAVSQQGFDRAIIHLTSGKNRSSRVGHFLVYQESLVRKCPGPLRPVPRLRFEGEAMPSCPDASACQTPNLQASQGAVRTAPADCAGYLVFGPFLFLNPGQYRVDFTLNAEETTETRPLARIEVTTGLLGRVLVARELYAKDLAADSGGFRTVSLNLSSEQGLGHVEFRVYVYGRGKVNVDAVDLVPQPKPTASPRSGIPTSAKPCSRRALARASACSTSPCTRRTRLVCFANGPRKARKSL